MQAIFPLLAFIWVMVLQIISLRESLSLQKGQLCCSMFFPACYWWFEWSNSFLADGQFNIAAKINLLKEGYFMKA
jgi:hypothetical protein